ncbi:PAS domain S-box protein [Lentimicrobium sp. L6]|uniref:PAS domain S-box protein n=1 Tax=Lentimicrobium sp. L6 TaxID=2735916 RepID=UPI001553F51C|nr:PAS domain S-box protein [Lentimicrobium sp. L6]NPD84872.1 PAS domain S-box protein [Lentimicrobium sp. L6]
MKENNKSSRNKEETTLDLIAQNIDDIIWKLDIQTMKLTYISPSVYSIRGFTPKEVMDGSVEDSCHPEDLKLALEKVNRLFYSSKNNRFSPNYKLEMRQTKKDGTYVWLEVKISLILNKDGKPVKAIGVSRDISDSKNETKELKKSLEREKFFADIIRHSSQPIGIGYLDGRGALLNQAAYDLLGYSEEEMTKINWRDDLTPAKWYAEEDEVLKESILEKKAKTYKKEYIHKSGRIIPIEIRVHPKFDDHGELSYFLAFITDITEIEKTRIKLDQTNERFNLALKGTNDGLWDWKVGSKTVYLSPRYLEIIGYHPGELEFSLDSLLDLIHPNDIDTVKYNQEHFAISQNIRLEQQFRLKHKKGYYVPVLSRVFKVVNEKGHAIRMIGTHIDLTEAHLMQQKIDEGELRYKTLFENSNIGIAISNEQGEVFESNATLKETLGIPYDSETRYSAEQFYYYSKDRKYFIELLNKDGEVKNFHFKGVGLDGEILWLSMSSRKLRIDGEIRILNALTDITQQVIAEQKLKESEERFKHLSKLTLEGILIHDNGLILDVNESFVKMCGYGKKELLHQDFFQICMENDDSRKEYFKELESSKQSKEMAIFTKRGIRTPVLVSSRITSFRGQSVQVSSFHNITNRIEAEQNIRKLSAAVEQSGHSIVITNTKGIIEYLNPQFVKMFEFSLLEALGKPISIIESGYHSAEFQKELWCQIEDGQVWKGEFLNKSKNDKLYWVSASISPIKDRDGQVTHYLSIMDDITQKKKFEKELIEAKKNAEKSDQLKSAFLANMSHEIRTPLNGIIGFTDLLNDPEEVFSGHEITRYLNIISNNGQLLLHLVNDIIDISKIESGQMHISVQEFSLSEVLQKLENSFENSMKPNVELRIQHITEEINLQTDFTRVFQVFNNLISNALKFTDRGYVSIDFEEETEHLMVCIEDTGCGISEEAQKIIFDRFAQGRPINDQLLGGTGLGLSITKGLVKLLGGEIWVDSVDGEGSVFRFRILKSMKKS